MTSQLKQRLIAALESAIENSSELLANVPDHPRNDYTQKMYTNEIAECQALINEINQKS